MTARAEAAAARLAATHERLTAAVSALASAEDWRSLLRLTSRVHRYSPNNLLLIAAQRPDATCVYGYKKWEEFGRQVGRRAGIEQHMVVHAQQRIERQRQPRRLQQ